jgi:predicted Zn-dependent protease
VTTPALDRAAELLAPSSLEVWEVFLLERSSTLVEVRGGRETLAHRVVETGVGLRGIAEGRLGFASTTRTDAGGLQECARRLGEAAAGSEPCPRFSLPAEAPSTPAFEAYRPIADGDSLEVGADLAAQAEAAAGRGTLVSGCHYRSDLGRIAIRNSLGLEVSFRFSRASVHLTCEVRDGNPASAYSSACHGYAAGDLDPRDLGLRVSSLAMARSQSRRNGGEKVVPLVLAPGAAAQLCAWCAPLACGGPGEGPDGGEAVGSHVLTLLDDPHLRSGYGSTPFDGEGVATGRCTFVEKGVRIAQAHTCASGAAVGRPSTGHAVRPDFAFPPRLGFHNLHLAPTPGASQDLVREVGEGLYLVEFLDVSPRAPARGFAGWGFRIRGGELAEPLEWEMPGMALGGILLQLSAVGQDLVTYPGGVGGATCLLERVAVS